MDLQAETRPGADAIRATSTYPRHPACLPAAEFGGGSYTMRFARNEADLLAVQKLRFDVFNVELGEGLDESFRTGLDQDEFDVNCHHVLVEERDSGEVVGTYRLQTSEMAAAGPGFYTAGEFDLSQLPAELVADAVEAGRACVAREHRNGRVLNLLWRAVASYVLQNRKRHLFGCCSLPTQDPNEAKQAFDFLVQGDFIHHDWPTRPLADYVCFGADFTPDINTSVKLPPLFASYLKLGAKITGRPALDRRFKTIDFLVVLDVRDLDPHTYRTFFR